MFWNEFINHESHKTLKSLKSKTANMGRAAKSAAFEDPGKVTYADHEHGQHVWLAALKIAETLTTIT